MCGKWEMWKLLQCYNSLVYFLTFEMSILYTVYTLLNISNVEFLSIIKKDNVTSFWLFSFDKLWNVKNEQVLINDWPRLCNISPEWKLTGRLMVMRWCAGRQSLRGTALSRLIVFCFFLNNSTYEPVPKCFWIPLSHLYGNYEAAASSQLA